MTHSEQINELAAALSAAQGMIENATKGSENPHFRSKYADLAEIINAVRPVFSTHGLAFTQCPAYEGGIASVETILMHKSGQYLSSTISIPVSKQDAHGIGSALTYCRRYALAAVAGVGQEDDDANAAVGSKEPPRQRSNGASKQQSAAPEEKTDLAIIGAEISRLIGGAKDLEAVAKVLDFYKTEIAGMQKDWQAKITGLAEAKRQELTPAAVNQ